VEEEGWEACGRGEPFALSSDIASRSSEAARGPISPFSPLSFLPNAVTVCIAVRLGARRVLRAAPPGFAHHPSQEMMRELALRVVLPHEIPAGDNEE
jgi:hypothetical protein